LKFSPPRREGFCDENPDTALVQRQDDKEETIRERLRVYHETTEPLLAYYRESGLLHSIPAQALSPDKVFGNIEKVISGLGVAETP
jgi:adenylate kinase